MSLSIEQQIELSNLAQEYLEKALADGEVFSEALCDWAMDKAEEALGL